MAAGIGGKHDALAGLGIWEADRESGEIRWSPVMRRIHEVDDDCELTKEFALTFYPGAAQERVRLALSDLIESGKGYDFETPFVTAKGNRKWVRVVAAAAERRNGVSTRIYGTVEDITVRKTQEYELRETRSRLEATFMALPDLLLEVDHEGRFTSCYGGGDERFLVPPEDFVGKLLEEVLPPHVAALGRQAMAQAAMQGQVRGLEYQLDVDGSARHFELSASHRPPSLPDENPGSLFTIRDVTERVAIQKSLRYRESLLSSLFELSHIGLALNDLETGQFLDLNEALLAPTGYTREEFVELSYFDITPPEYAPQEAQALEDLRTIGRYGFVKEYIRKDGSRYPVSLNGMRVEDASGRSLIWSFVEDISERRALENTLRSERDQLSQVMEASPVAIVRLDTSGQIVFANTEAEAVLGLSPSQITGVAFDAPSWKITCVDGGEFPAGDLPFNQVMATRRVVRNVVHAIEDSDGNRRILSINAAPLMAGPVIEGVICMASDVTELIESREKLRLNEERLRLATSAARLGIWSYQPDLDRVYFSPECFVIGGYSEVKPEMSGEEYRSLVHPDDRERVVASIYGCISGKKESYREQIRHLAGDGTYIWTLATGRVAGRHADGRTRIITGTFQDISSEKEYEQLLAQSRDAADRANKAKSDFLANMSHEIRTPLNGVLGMAKLLAKSELNEKQGFYVDTLLHSGQALLSLLENVLDISRIEAGELILEVDDFDLNRMAGEAIKAVAGIALNKGLTLEMEVEPSLAPVRRGDMRRLRQVLINLLGNAVKFTEQGSVELRVRPGAGDDVEFEVADTGPGLAPDQQESIFSRFTQADNSNTRKHEGTGLGLAICKELVELAGGEITLQSEVGKGATFRFTWPLPVVDGAPECRNRDLSPASIHGTARDGVVLVVEDNETNLAVLDDALRSAGHDVVQARNGLEALDVVTSVDVSVILMDLHMPRMNGEEAIKRIRAMPEPISSVPIVTLSADATVETNRKIKALNVQRSFTKPLDLDAVVGEVDEWTLSRRRASEAI